MTKTKTIIIFLTVFFGVLLFAKGSFAAVNLPWSTTFNCTDVIQNNSFNCDGINEWHGGWNAGCTYPTGYDQITSNANYSGGAGGKGFRHWLNDGDNVNGGGMAITLNPAPTDVYFRWYTRYQSGNTGSGGGTGNKMLYLWDSAGSAFLYFVIEWQSANARITTQTGDSRNLWSTGGGYQDVFANGYVSDGSWHSLEIRIKRETTTSPANGIWQYWVDGQLKANHTDINYGMLERGAGVEYIVLGSNVKGLNNGNCIYVDYDDIAISSTGPIGPITASDTTPPTISNGSPTGTLAVGTTQTTMSVTTNESATCRWSSTANTAYSSMTGMFLTPPGTNHSTTITGLQNGQTYNRYIRCQDTAGNTNASDYTITFSVASGSDTTPPAPPSGVTVI